MALHGESAAIVLALVILAVGVLIAYVAYRFVRGSLRRLGLSPGAVGWILLGTFIGGLINLPVAPFGEGFLAVNVGGAVIPVLLSLYLWRKNALPVSEVLVGVAFVATISYLVTDYEPGIGVFAVFPLWLLPALGAALIAAFAYWHERDDASSLAYASGTLGTLIGADLLRLPQILAGPAPEAGTVLSIGGGAVFDMVYLTGILAVAMEAGVMAKRRQDLSQPGDDNPIEAEYQAWLEKKRREWSDARQEDPREQRRDHSNLRTPLERTQAHLDRQEDGSGSRPVRQVRHTEAPWQPVER